MSNLDLISPSTCILLGAAILVTYKVAAYLGSPVSRLPPSPPSDPLIGHALKIPLDEPYKTYAEWGKKYGDIISARAAGRTLIILNTFAAARELLEKQSALFSHRPYVPVFELGGWGTSTPFLQYGNTLRTHRRMMLKYLNAISPSSAAGISQRSQIVTFLKRVLAKPEAFGEYSNAMISGIIIEVVYGHKVTSIDDEYTKLAEQAVRLTDEVGSVGVTIIDLFPILRHLPAWIPGMGLKRHVLTMRKFVDEVIEKPFQDSKMRKASGEPSSCMVSDLLHESGESGNSEHEETLKQASFSVFNAGADTTKVVVMTFFAMMARYPEVALKAQREIDCVIGSDPERLPTLEDRKSLPYLECVLKEVYRINPSVPLTIPHSSTQPVELRNWTIPSGALAIPNIWQMTRDERFFPDPEEFSPERYETKESPKAGSKAGQSDFGYGQDDPTAIVFGFGRRICPGKAFADSNLFVIIACILAVFDIRTYKDPILGEVEMPEFIFDRTFTRTPRPFKCTVVPRSERHAKLIRELNSDN